MKELNAELELLAERVKKLEEKDASDVRDDAREVPDKVQENMSKDIHKRFTIKGLDAELELLAERVKKLEEKDASDVRDDAREVPDKVQEKLNGIEDIVKSYDKKIGDLERELLQARHNSNIEKDNDLKGIDGEVCDKTLIVKPNLKEQTKARHSKTYECEFCDETFTESWKMEEHLEHHGNERPFKCSICDKGFYRKWRMEKHTSDHRVDIKFCHYYNNDKPCPYDKVGCKFKHENAPECRFNLKCTFKLCQFTHTTKKGEEVVHREFMKPLEDAEAEAVEVNVENDYGVLGSESFLADMESMEGVVDEDNYSEDVEAVELNEENDDEDSESEDNYDNYYEDSDSCDSSNEVDAQNELLWRMLQQKVNSQVKKRMPHKV